MLRKSIRYSLFLFFILTTGLRAQEDIIIISSSPDELIFEYSPKVISLETIPIDGLNFIKVSILNCRYDLSSTADCPLIPSRLVNIGIPQETGNTYQIISSTFKEYDGKLMPALRPSKDLNQTLVKFNATVYNNFRANTDVISLSDFGIVRGLPVQTLKILPVLFNGSDSKYRVYSSITVKVKFAKKNIASSGKADNFLNGIVLNQSVANQWVAKENTGFQKTSIKNSVLATGRWYRFEATVEGLYKISKSMLASFGIDAATVDPRTIKIYNNGGRVLPQELNAVRPVDLVENPITVLGQEDGKFDDADYIVFYGRGVNFWDYDTTSFSIKRAQNPYSSTNYYWITSGGVAGKRFEAKVGLTITNPAIQTTTPAFAFRDDDKVNIGQTGLIFVGDEFSDVTKTRTYSSLLEGIIETNPVSYRFSFTNKSASSRDLKVEENSSVLFDRTLDGSYGDSYQIAAWDTSSYTVTRSYPNSTSNLKFTYSAGGSNSYGYLDFFEIYYTRDLKARTNEFPFFSNLTDGIKEYRLSGFTSANVSVLDVSDVSSIKFITNPISQLNDEYRFQVNESRLKQSKYYAFTGQNYKTPTNPVEILNQNLRGIALGAEHIIISPKEFSTQAEKLRNYRQSQSPYPMSSIIVYIDEIYNEFSGGNRDVSAIRDFIRYAYTNWSISAKYVLLFGHGDYDYKNIEGKGINFVPPNESLLSFHEIDSYSNDDFYVAVVGSDEKIDLAIGRIPARNAADIGNYVDKVIKYETNNDRELYKNLITLAADDQWTSNGPDLAPNTAQSETLANYYIPNSYDLQKIYLVNYPTVQTSLGRRKPDVNKAIIEAINNGTLIFNWVGHGSPDLWAHEQVFVQSVTVPQLKNSRYFFLTAATCDFGFYDKTDLISGAEALVLKENAGAIATFTAVRLVFSIDNAILNQEFYKNLLGSERGINNLPISIGEAYYKTKQLYHNVNDQKYHIFGDPAIRLRVPQYKASVDSINGKDAAHSVQLKALGNVTVKGTIRKTDNTVWSDFNGEGILSVFDAKYRMPLPEISTYDSMTVTGGVIFKGRVSVVAGKFAANFVVPKDISYENKTGKIVFYFFDATKDGLAYNDSVVIGGTESNPSNNGKGPEIQISFDDANSGNGILVQPNSTMYIKLAHHTGLNTTGTGVGHKIEGVLNDNYSNPIDFTNYFTGDIDAGGKTGKVAYKFNNLAQGGYSIRVKAWDVFNNATTQTADFKVSADDSFAIEYVMNYPNPFSGSTSFTFQQNLAEPIDVKILVYTVSGRKIHEIEQKWISEKFVKIEWDGKDYDGNLLANGVYLYKVIAKPTARNEVKTIYGKLAIIR